MAALMITVVGCGRGSSAYNHIKELPYSEWDKYAATLPVERRLDLHKEIMERSGHNPKMTIEASFSTDPENAYKALTNRISRGDDSRYYLGVLYEINRSPSFKICSQPDRKVVQDYLKGITSYPEHKRYRPDFYDC